MYGIIDCDNCYVSCERVFRPDLKDKPVVVLSNNDGCVVARSNEAKKMGIKAGTPYFQLAEQFPNQKIAVFSSNYELYGELTGRNNIVIERTWRELNGEDCVLNEEMAKKKSICTSRSFNGMITDLDGLRTHVSNYAARCAEKLRQQGTVASIVGVFLNTNAFREDLPQYWNFQEMRLVTPSSSTITIVKAANEVLQKLYRQGYHYKKAGVIVMGIGPNSPIQQDLFDINAEQLEKMKRLDAVIDRINKVNGTETIVLGSQQYTQKDGKGKANVFANAIKHDFKSKNPTTRWSDIIVLK